MEDCSRSRWLMADTGEDARFSLASLAKVSVGVGVVVVVVVDVVALKSPFLLISSPRCLIMASSLSFSLESWNSSWLTICSWTRVWAIVLSSIG